MSSARRLFLTTATGIATVLAAVVLLSASLDPARTAAPSPPPNPTTGEPPDPEA
jgi:hypothetical protein